MTSQSKERVPDIDIRWARREDAGAIARLFLVSSDGLAAYIWSRTNMPGVPLEEIGAARYRRTGTAFSYENALVAVARGEVVGMVHAFETERDPDEPGENDPVLRPYAELSDPGSLYVSGLAVDARHRARGIGGELLDCADGLALARVLPASLSSASITTSGRSPSISGGAFGKLPDGRSSRTRVFATGMAMRC